MMHEHETIEVPIPTGGVLQRAEYSWSEKHIETRPVGKDAADYWQLSEDERHPE